jgi:hypothetical protein
VQALQQLERLEDEADLVAAQALGVHVKEGRDERRSCAAV